MNTTTQEKSMSIEQMCIDAKKRLATRINRSAGQHLRAMRESSYVQRNRAFDAAASTASSDGSLDRKQSVAA